MANVNDKGYKIACSYTITGGTWDGNPDEPYFREDYQQRLSIAKEYLIEDPVTLSRALQFIDKLDQAVRGTLGDVI